MQVCLKYQVMESSITRDGILALIEEKEKLESEINQMKSILDSVSNYIIQKLCYKISVKPNLNISVYGN